MSVYSRYKNVARRQEIKAATHGPPEVRDVVPPMNRHQKRAQKSALASKRKLLITRRGK